MLEGLEIKTMEVKWIPGILGIGNDQRFENVHTLTMFFGKTLEPAKMAIPYMINWIDAGKAERRHILDCLEETFRLGELTENANPFLIERQQVHRDCLSGQGFFVASPIRHIQVKTVVDIDGDNDHGIGSDPVYQAMYDNLLQKHQDKVKELDTATLRLTSLKEEYGRLEKENERLDCDVKRLSAMNDRQRDDIVKVTEVKREAEDRLGALQRRYDKLQDEFAALRTKADEERDSAKNIIEIIKGRETSLLKQVGDLGSKLAAAEGERIKEFMVRAGEGGGRWQILHPVIEIMSEGEISLAWADRDGAIWCYGLEHDIRELPE